MPIDWTKSKYSRKHRLFLSKKPEDMAFFTLCDGAVRSAKTLSIIYKIPQIFDFVGNEYLKVFSGYSKNTVRNCITALSSAAENLTATQIFRVQHGISGTQMSCQSTTIPFIIWLCQGLHRKMQGQLLIATPKAQITGFIGNG